MLIINENITILQTDLKFDFVRSSGPGGQNVNKVSTAVQLRFDVRAATCLNETQKARLSKLAGKRLTTDGELIIFARRYRSQEKNRQDSLERLANLVQKALVEPKIRLKKKPGKAVKERRLKEKRKKSEKKKNRDNEIRFDE